MEYNTQNDLLLNKLMQFYHKDNNFEKMLEIINGQSNISLRIVDWFATNYSKKYYTVYNIPTDSRFKVYNDSGMLISSNEWNLATGAKATLVIAKDK